jgi:hypothetical protein
VLMILPPLDKFAGVPDVIETGSAVS